MAPPPRSCDTFVFVGGGGRVGAPAHTLFGKNSDRPSDEAHEVIYVPARTYAPGAKVRCTHIEIAQSERTHAVVLSRPAWLWGCEMGANEHGVVGGNEAVHSLLASELGTEPRLLGMDLLRLALERSESAREAVEVTASLLEAHGQGGACAEDDDWTYENGFLYADAHEAFVMETAGVRHWACERVTAGRSRNISNGLSIRTNIFSCSDGIQAICRQRGWWSGDDPFDWKRALSAGGRAHASLEPCGREKAGAAHLDRMSAAAAKGDLAPADAVGWVRAMASTLRDEDSGICFRDLHSFCSTGSQISWICASPLTASHFFTGASDPAMCSYKRFSFADAAPSTAASDGRDGDDHGTRDLWDAWRELALGGPADGGIGGAVKTREAVRVLEEEGLALLGDGSAERSDGRPRLSLAAAGAREREIVRYVRRARTGEGDASTRS